MTFLSVSETYIHCVKRSLIQSLMVKTLGNSAVTSFMQNVKDIHKDGFLIIANLLVSKAKKKEGRDQKERWCSGKKGRRDWVSRPNLPLSTELI